MRNFCKSDFLRSCCSQLIQLWCHSDITSFPAYKRKTRRQFACSRSRWRATSWIKRPFYYIYFDDRQQEKNPVHILSKSSRPSELVAVAGELTANLLADTSHNKFPFLPRTFQSINRSSVLSCDWLQRVCLFCFFLLAQQTSLPWFI